MPNQTSSEVLGIPRTHYEALCEERDKYKSDMEGWKKEAMRLEEELAEMKKQIGQTKGEPQ